MLKLHIDTTQEAVMATEKLELHTGHLTRGIIGRSIALDALCIFLYATFTG